VNATAQRAEQLTLARWQHRTRPAFRWTAFRGVLLVFGAVFGTVIVIHLIPNFGIPMHSDVSWRFRLQVASEPGLTEAIPYGMAILDARPNTYWEACIEYHRSFGRWDCLDVGFLRLTARLADANADLWRLVFALFGSAAVAVFWMIARELRMPTGVAAGLALGLVLAPLDVWTEYKASETKGVFFFMLALLLTLRATGWRQNALGAGAMLAAVLVKETFAAGWIAVLGALVYRQLDRNQGERMHLLRSVGWSLVPHAVAAMLIGGFVVLLKVLVPAQHDYAFLITGARPSLSQYAQTYLAALEPMLLRPTLLPAIAILVLGASLFCLIWSAESRRSMLRGYLSASTACLVFGFGLAILLHAAVYFETRRPIDDSRYVVPANFIAALLLGVLMTPMLRALPRSGGPAFSAVAAAVLGVVFVQLYGLPNELTIVGLVLGSAVIVVMAGAAALRLGRASFSAAVVGGLLVMLAVPGLDRSLDVAGWEQANQRDWTRFLNELAAAAQPGGHVQLIFDEPFMIEHAWAAETHTLLNGQTTLTYHLDVEDTRPYEGESGLVRFAVESFNAQRRPLPTEQDGSVTYVRASRRGQARSQPERVRGEAALNFLMSDPGGFLDNRYRAGKQSYFVYSIGRTDPRR
jgi:hypothetical protein